MTATRPIVRYHGGKWRLAPWIIGHFPSHRVYVEPYGGGGSVLIRKDRCYAEVYNDLDGEIVNLFRVARERGEELIAAISLTPFSRSEFEVSYQAVDDALEQARRTLVRSFMGFGSASVSKQRSGFRANCNRPWTIPAHDWARLPESLWAVIQRLQGVVVENRDAILCMTAHDSPTTLHYVDPPYVQETRNLHNGEHVYRHEMDDAQHEVLAGFLHSLQGAVVLSGYRCPIYDDLFGDWHRVDRRSFADGAKARIESLWINPVAQEQMPAPSLFSEAVA